MNVLNKYLTSILLVAGIGISSSASAIDLTGLMTVDAKVVALAPILDGNGDPILDGNGDPILIQKYKGGSYFALGVNNPLTGVSIEGGAAGGIILDTHQRFILNPDVPNPPTGTGYGSTPVQESTVLTSFKFFGVNTYIGTNGLSYQSGNIKPVVSATVDVIGNLTVELSSWEVEWNGSVFEQGPRASQAAGFTPAYGTYDFDTGHYVVSWLSKIVGGPFNGVPGYWTLEGTILADPVDADATAGPQTLNVKSKGNGFSVALLLTDQLGRTVDPSSINEGVSITTAGGVDIPAGSISENVAGRTINGDTLTVVFDDPATGTRQDIIAAVSDATDGSTVTVCASGTARDADGILRPFEGCDDITIRNKGNQ